MSLTDEEILNKGDNPSEDASGDDEYMEDVVDQEAFFDPNAADEDDAEAETVEQEKSIDELAAEPYVEPEEEAEV